MSSYSDSSIQLPKSFMYGFVPWPEDFIIRYRQAGYWCGETFGNVLFKCAEKYGDKIALVGGDKRWGSVAKLTDVVV
jgi:2,3-dihydroxybenzoate-AMP ligase